MSSLLQRIILLVETQKYRVSDHGDEELADDRIPSGDAIAGLERSVVIEEYSDTGRGPSLLVLTYDAPERPIHVV